MNKIVNFLGIREKQCGCDFLPYDISSRNKTNKQANNQSNLLSLTVSCEKSGCLIRCK